MADSAFFTPLNHEALLAVRGPDAAKFLQGQLTCNLNYLDERTCSLGARCTPKGRMISSFRIIQEGDGYLLALASELLEAQLVEADLNQWLLGQVRAGIGQVMPQTRELFIPQMINLQAVGGVSFKKGCYTGQEIVARMQYLGKLKRHLYRLSLEAGHDVPAPGTPLFSPTHNSSVGEVVLGAKAENGIELLAVLTSDAAQAGDIHVGDLQGPSLSLLELPYQLDRDREIQR